MSLPAAVCVLLSEWISYLLAAVPPRSRRTFVELLIGCMLNPEGWVTRAIGAICREAHWTTYYKLIERAHVSVADLSIRVLQLVQRVFPADLVTLIIDDTLVLRCAKTGPGISIKHDHSHKANRPTFLNAQCWVTLALVVRVHLGSALTVPLRSWLVEESGQRGKLWVARQLIDSIRGHVKHVRLLIDAWFMRRRLILPLLEQQVRIIGQVRRDTALFLLRIPAMADTESGDGGQCRSEATQVVGLSLRVSAMGVGGMVFSEGFLGVQLDAVGVVDEPIEDGVGDAIAAQVGVPVLHR